MSNDSRIVGITPEQAADVAQFDLSQATVVASYASKNIFSFQFQFFAAFDGTNNTLDNAAPRANNYATNVSALSTSINKHIRENQYAGRYIPGVGTPGTTWYSGLLPTTEAIARANQTYNAFASKAETWLKDNKALNRDASGLVSVALASFSRGDAASAMFSQLLYEKGLIVDGKVLIAPGQINIGANLMFDPVTTYARGNLAYAPNVASSVEIQAANEYRDRFKVVGYTAQPDIHRSWSSSAPAAATA
jgi:hypothetical protein